VFLISSLIVDNQLVDLDRSGNVLQYHAISIPDGDPRSQIDEPIERFWPALRRSPG
jgi:hypothetical protein